MRVVIVGPGRIGCGYLAPLFRSAGWEVVFAARDEATAARIRGVGRFTVRTTAAPAAGNGQAGVAAPARRLLVQGIDAVPIGSPGWVEAVAGADLVCTSVGVARVAPLGRPLARALAARPGRRPVDVWTVENGDCAPVLEAAVLGAAGRPLSPVGFAGAVATGAVAHGSWASPGRLPEFVGDAFGSLLVDRGRLLTALPAIPGVVGTGDYLARLREELYVFNAGHAICAYLGWHRGHATVADAVADPVLRPVVAGSMLEARRALLAAHPSLGPDLHGPVAESLARFGDPELADPVARVAREPIRKLAPGDRLLGPAELIRRQTGRVPAYFALAIAGALLYRDHHDGQSRRLAADLERVGVMAVLASACGLAPGHPLAEAVVACYRGFVITADGTALPPVHGGSPGRTPPELAAETPA
jgi:mannitol-1-phosphate 5-dehydrogenase